MGQRVVFPGAKTDVFIGFYCSMQIPVVSLMVCCSSVYGQSSLHMVDKTQLGIFWNQISSALGHSGKDQWKRQSFYQAVPNTNKGFTTKLTKLCGKHPRMLDMLWIIIELSLIIIVDPALFPNLPWPPMIHIQELMVMGCDFLAKRPGLVEAAPGRYDDDTIVGVAQVQRALQYPTVSFPYGPPESQKAERRIANKIATYSDWDHELLSLALKVCSSG